MSEPVETLTVCSPCCGAPQKLVVEMELTPQPTRYYDCPACGDRIEVNLEVDR